MKLNYIYKGNCRDVMKKSFDNESVDLVFADPPYNLSGNGLKWQNKGLGGDWFMVNEKWDKMSAPEYIQFTKEWLPGRHPGF